MFRTFQTMLVMVVAAGILPLVACAQSGQHATSGDGTDADGSSVYSVADPATTIQDDPVQDDDPQDADGAEPTTPTGEENASEWYRDPVCRFVFYSVLEGLYEDGVPTEVVNLIAPPESDQDTNLKHSFVFQCDICHATYEAFTLYQQRQSLIGSEVTTFGPGVDAAVVENLKSDQIYTRLRAMGDLVNMWVNRRIEMMRLTNTEKEQLLGKLMEYAKKGDETFRSLKNEPGSVYSRWDFYDGCQACRAVKNIHEAFRNRQRSDGE